jgi:hypothetical protein
MRRRSKPGKKVLVEKLPEIKEIEEEDSFKKSSTIRPKIKSRNLLWFAAFVSAIFCFFAFSFLFSSAEVAVNPRTEDVVLNENLSASRDSNGNSLSYNLVIIPGEESGTIQATGEGDVSEKAVGSVIIYNAFNTSPQTLSIDTRLEGSNGKIYKTQTKTVIPGASAKGTPGSVEVKIYASAPGPDYNSGPLDFSIIGFKGTPKYEKFYARSKGDISGGFSGKAPIISDEDKAALLANLNTSLQAKLLKRAMDQVPAGFVLFNGATFFDIGKTNISSIEKDGNTTLTLTGTLYGLLFSEEKLTKKIADDNIEDYDGSDIYIVKMKDLTFLLTNKDNISVEEAKNINFNLSGKTKIVLKLDVNKFIIDLLGRSKGDFNQTLAQYKNIDSATLRLSPPWRRSFPDKIKNIKVLVSYPQ